MLSQRMTWSDTRRIGEHWWLCICITDWSCMSSSNIVSRKHWNGSYASDTLPCMQHTFVDKHLLNTTYLPFGATPSFTTIGHELISPTYPTYQLPDLSNPPTLHKVRRKVHCCSSRVNPRRHRLLHCLSPRMQFCIHDRHANLYLCIFRSLKPTHNPVIAPSSPNTSPILTWMSQNYILGIMSPVNHFYVAN